MSDFPAPEVCHECGLHTCLGECFDEDYLETVAREQQAAASRRDREHDDRCTPCGHTWHGLACTAQRAAFPCGCPTSYRVAS